MSNIFEIVGEFPCSITFFARNVPRRTSDVPDPNCGWKIRNDGVAASTCGKCPMSSAHSGSGSLRVNHSLGGRDNDAHGNRWQMIVSDPSSRIPPRTLSFNPLITELTVITVIIQITIPRIVSTDRNGFCRSVSIASTTCSHHSMDLPRATSFRSGNARLCGNVLLIDAITISSLRS
jgi:hypothetical protein